MKHIKIHKMKGIKIWYVFKNTNQSQSLMNFAIIFGDRLDT